MMSNHQFIAQLFIKSFTQTHSSKLKIGSITFRTMWVALKRAFFLTRGIPWHALLMLRVKPDRRCSNVDTHQEGLVARDELRRRLPHKTTRLWWSSLSLGWPCRDSPNPPNSYFQAFFNSRTIHIYSYWHKESYCHFTLTCFIGFISLMGFYSLLIPDILWSLLIAKTLYTITYIIFIAFVLLVLFQCLN